jgi:hypothetical protein
MPVVKIRIVAVGVAVRGVDVPVRVWLSDRGTRRMRMVVMDVVAMEMLVSQRLVNVLVDVPLAEMQPDAEAHQQAAGGEIAGERLVQADDRQSGSEERRGREIRAGPGRAEQDTTDY